MMRRIGLIAIVVVASLGWAGSAQAAVANAYESGSTLYYIADAGETNNVAIGLSGGWLTIDDDVAITTGIHCAHPGPDATFVQCRTSGITTIWVETADGNDYIDAYTGLYTVIHAGAGNDTAWGGTGTDSLWGEAGNDYLNGWSGDDWLIGGVGTDQVFGGSGSWDVVSYTDSPVGVVVDLDGVADDGASGENDTIGADLEVLHGSKFGDWLLGNASANSISGLSGNDYLFGFDGNDSLYGDGFSDYVIGADYFSGGNGVDVVSYTDHTVSQPVVADIDGVVGDDGAAGEGDTILSDVENLDGGPGADWLFGSSGANQMDGWGGNDFVYGQGGNDTLSGSDGADYLYGGDQNDVINGGAGNDFLYGQNHSDTLNGGSGTDTCDVGPGGTSTTSCEA